MPKKGQPPEEGKPPKLAEWFREKVYRRYGIPGLAGLAVLAAAAYVYTNWAKVKTWPGVDAVVTLICRQPVPKADPNRFSILVAHLENDDQREHERLIIEALKEFEGVERLRLDRTIPLDGPAPELMEKRGQEEAQRYLKESGASVLIWGTVHRLGGKTAYKLYWTPSHGGGRQSGLFEAQLRLPEVFWGDLAEILGLQVSAGAAEFEAQEGRYVPPDRLRPFIAQVKKLLEASRGRPGWDADARGKTLVILANALYTLGEQSGQNQPLEEAVTAYREALKERTRERVPLAWATTQNNLGNALRSLGERESGTKRLEAAVKAFQAALEVVEPAQATYYVEMYKANLQKAEAMIRERRK
jgi:exonuclease VII small subunit